MEKFLIRGGNKLSGTVHVSGAKNVALKALVAASLTDEKVIIHNIPLISDFEIMVDIIKSLGGIVEISDHTATVQVREFKRHEISLDEASHIRTSSMFLSPLLARSKEAIIPNPGGCRLGARPIDRTVDGISKMNVDITYNSEDGYFHAKTTGLKGIDYTFEKNTHTGTETLIIAAVMAKGTTVLHNAAEEPEIDDLISLLNKMGGKITRSGKREITIQGVEKLHGTEYTISPDRNEIVTFAIAALATKGDVRITDAGKVDLEAFLEKVSEAGGEFEKKGDDIRFFFKGEMHAVDVTTEVYPGFMTDWQAPWAILMTQANGESIIHETVFENKLGYVKDLLKMGARIEMFNPQVEDPQEVYNFNLEDDKPGFIHAIKIHGPTHLHDAVMTMIDLRAGAAVVLAALVAKGLSSVHGIHLVDRGYEHFEKRLSSLGADIQRISEGR